VSGLRGKKKRYGKKKPARQSAAGLSGHHSAGAGKIKLKLKNQRVELTCVRAPLTQPGKFVGSSEKKNKESN